MDAVLRQFAAVARALGAAEGQTHIAAHDGVDETGARADAPGQGLTARGNISLLSAKQRVITQFEPITGRALNTYKATTKEIPFAVPVTGNFGLLYAYNKFGASFDLNFTDEYATNQAYPINNGVALTNANGNIFRDSLLTMAVGVSYRVRPSAQVFLNVNNIAAEGPRIYTYRPDRLRQDIRQNMSLSVGITGQF